VNDQSRQFFVLLIGISVVAGAMWTAIIAPMTKRQTEDEAVLEAEKHEIATGRDVLERAVETDDVIRKLEGNAREYESLWAVAADASALYETLREFARESGVEIDRIEPRRVVLLPTLEGLLKEHEFKAERAGYQIDVHGSFESVARFVRAVQGGTGLSRIDTIRIIPGSTEGDLLDVVSATVCTSNVGLVGALPSFAQATAKEGS